MVYPHSYRTEHSETRTTNSVYGEYYAQHQSKRIPIQPDLLKIIQFIDSHRGRFLKDLADVVMIKSVSGNLEYKDEVQKMIDFTQNWLSKLGLKYERFNIGFHELGGEKHRLPVILLASLGNDQRKKTLCIYVHLDVKEPEASKWQTDPWSVSQVGHSIFGCGVAQGKATLIHWFHIIEAFQKSNIEFPVNLKFIIESMYHYDSVGLADFLPLRKHDFFVDIDNIIVCDGEWIGEKHPCIIYGTIGVIHHDIFIEKVPGSKTDPRDDMVEIFKEIVDEKEHILIPHFDDIVSQITPEEEKMYEDICDFNIDDIRDNLPSYKQKWDKVKLLMHYWRLPSISIGETEECTCEKKEVDIVKRHFVVKIVPRQIINRTVNMTKNHINSVVKKLNIENKVTCEEVSSTRYWHESVANPNYQAARRATIQIYKEDPSMIKLDKPMVLLTILDRVLENNILLLPLVTSGSNASMENENITVRTFYESTKLLAAYLFQLAK
ncbi:cytosolic non-specific dipeptidase [Tribolium castaneum]|uniref:Cytosolic non-specific dipeptidase-like Protein n=1 Tax=Tribolium castaneum TaxID=7070 RepID=A0A139W8R1_TRICA|nr:PREDICTED: cytosolic non-specific dipeptidase [Tribolium castaneum]KXZ75665.1 Cytosolic non-specific dipeptidase-like Protein [Tribolium castaneum]|eukprot:XP_008199138.1 PREDICTED: cytosolic non-specific dipeptidase [Tribolium castaneum]